MLILREWFQKENWKHSHTFSKTEIEEENKTIILTCIQKWNMLNFRETFRKCGGMLGGDYTEHENNLFWELEFM